MRLVVVVPSLNIVFVCVAVFLVNWVYAPTFFEAHVFTLSVVCTTVIMAGCVGAVFGFPKFTVIGLAGMSYVVMMILFLYLHQYADEQSPIYLWVAMLFSAVGSILIAYGHALDIKRAKSNANDYVTAAEEVPEGMKLRKRSPT